MDHLSLDSLEGYPHASVFDQGPKTVRLALDEGDGVAAHSHPGRDVLIAVLEGTVEVELDEESLTAETGDVVRFDGEREVSPEAVTAATALVVFVPTA